MRFYLRSLLAVGRMILGRRSAPPPGVEVMPTYLPEPLRVEPPVRDVPMVWCWCGTPHPAAYWHDGTHGQIDRDIQVWVERDWGCTDRNQEFVMMLNLQQRRRDGERLGCD